MDNNSDNSLEQYYSRRDDFLRLLTQNSQFIFEVTKCCGYGEWVSVFKDQPIVQLYNNIENQFAGLRPKELCAIDISGNKLLVPETSNLTLRLLIKNNPSFFKPIYPLPAYVIYRIYIDEGCCHKGKHDNIPMDNNYCGNCIVHN